jgi:hypothetical protein
MEKYYYISGLDGRADSVQTIIETVFQADWSIFKVLNTRYIMKYENHVIVPLFKIICLTSQQEVRFIPIRGAQREALPW